MGGYFCVLESCFPRTLTRYDKAIGDAWGEAISAVKTGQKTKDEAVNEFYDKVAATYPDIEIDR